MEMHFFGRREGKIIFMFPTTQISSFIVSSLRLCPFCILVLSSGKNHCQTNQRLLNLLYECFSLLSDFRKNALGFSSLHSSSQSFFCNFSQAKMLFLNGKPSSKDKTDKKEKLNSDRPYSANNGTKAKLSKDFF